MKNLLVKQQRLLSAGARKPDVLQDLYLRFLKQAKTSVASQKSEPPAGIDALKKVLASAKSKK